MSNRKCAVAGQFYPNSANEIESYIKQFSQELHTLKNSMNIKAIIVPHAGYIYSGFTANIAYYLASKQEFKRLIVIGPSHRVFVENTSIGLFDEYETPLGNIPIDNDYAKELQAQFDFVSFNEQAHHEHSTETQAPFMKYYFDDISMIELVYGRQDDQTLGALIEYCMQDEDNLVIISTDLSHFYTLKEANFLDNICLKAILEKKIGQFDSGCEACGMIGIKALMHTAIKKDLNVELLHYCTSFERSQDASSVVGYCSFIVGE